jgi:sigma-B regulation protein RsbU (phosphoserine phosphatase)
MTAGAEELRSVSNRGQAMEPEMAVTYPLEDLQRPNGGITALQFSEPPFRWDCESSTRWIAEDLRRARELQILLLPRKLVGKDGLEIAAGFRPAHGVSGDIFDLFDCTDDRVVLTLGDVSGKGAAAAIYGAVVSGLLWTMVGRLRRPARLLQALNEALLERRIESQSVSLLVLSWQAQCRRLRLASAGAIRPLICRNGEVRELDLGGVPLGLWEKWEYEEASLQMETRDVVVLCSDGITEQENPAGEQYDRRIVQVLRNVWQQSPQSIVDAIFDDLDRFTGSLPARSDDQTLAAFKVR